MSRPLPSHNRYFVPINLGQIKQELYSTADHETRGHDDAFNKIPTEQNNFMETEHNVKEKEIKDEPMVYKEWENNYVTNINIKNSDLTSVNSETLTDEDEERERLVNFNMREEDIKDEPMSYIELKNYHILYDHSCVNNVIHEEREVNFNVKEEIKDEPNSYKELVSDCVDSINMENSDLNDVTDVILIDKDNVKHEEREKIINCNVKVEEIRDEPMSCKELENDHNLHDHSYAINVIHEEGDIVVNFNVEAEIKDEPMSKELESDCIDYISIGNNEILTGKDNIIHKEIGRVTNYNLDVHMEEIKIEEADGEESAGAAPAEKCKETHAGKIQDGSTLTPGTKNILEKPRTRSTVVEEATSRNIGRYVLRGTKTAYNRQASTNSYSDTAIYKSNISMGSDNDDCGNVFDEKHLLIERVVAVKKTRHPKSPQQRTISRKQRLNRTGVVDEQTGTHREDKLFECHICKIKFTLKCHLKTHLRIHTGEKPYECEICKVRFTQKGSLNNHLRIHTGEKPYECEICKVRFLWKGCLRNHIQIHTGEKPYECKICKVRFTLNLHLKNHLRIHTGEKPYECDICKGRFTRNSHLKNHLKIHTGEKPYECEICKVRFSEKGSLSKHIRIHTGEKPYECEICKVRFNRNGSLKIHLRIHTGEKPYECKICKVRFTRNLHLKNHLRIHTGEKPYECDICKGRFTRNSHLKNHLKIHTGEKPYECEICKVRFSEKGSLNKHLRIHIEKPYEYEICNDRFSEKYY